MPSMEPSSAAQALNFFLNSMTPEVFVTRLRSVTDPAMGYSSEDIQSLLDGLANVGFDRAVAQSQKVVEAEDQDDLHCVRCHKTYLERDNGVEACKIEHTHTFTVAAFSSLSPSAHCKNCGQVPPPSAVVGKPCIVARHTTNPKEVGKTTLVKRCEEMGCNGPKLLEGFRAATAKGVPNAKKNEAKEDQKPIAKLPFSFAPRAPTPPSEASSTATSSTPPSTLNSSTGSSTTSSTTTAAESSKATATTKSEKVFSFGNTAKNVASTPTPQGATGSAPKMNIFGASSNRA
ncbi:hypothetical protein NMY22_g13726 [Coprinellus aureogranulatus]|nr:hypothetical protein NMY22_g13726 [Coprinellus aureogranulatus]